MREKQVIAHRYVLLRAHENFDRALEMLTDEDWILFSECLAPIFSDSYAAVPHLSLARVIAMFNAGVLSLKATTKDAEFSQDDKGHVLIEAENEMLNYEVMVDARGQTSAPLDELPFPSLVKILDNGKAHLKAPFKIKTNLHQPPSIYCLALPQVLERHPFSQGLANCADNGRIVAQAIFKDFDK